jgi:hypothetical protein
MLYKSLELRGFRMENKKILLAILTVALVLGMTACDTGDTGGTGGGYDGTMTLNLPPTNGRLTIIGLESYNEKFVQAQTYYENP